jgi:hypothetical protein
LPLQATASHLSSFCSNPGDYGTAAMISFLS